MERRELTYNKSPQNIQELIESLHVLFSEEKVNIEEVQEVMERYDSREEEWDCFAHYDEHRYTRNLVDQGNGKFNLMVLCWGEGMGSSIHSHADSHCFMKVLDGSLRETLFNWPSQSERRCEMQPRMVNDYGRNQVAYINDSHGLHRVENVSHTDTACSLHLYSPPFDSCFSFDQRTGKKHVAKVTFWSKFGERTPLTTGGCSAVMEPEDN
ncbi:cysteine dioxygenase type 1-like [Acanthaster planci]|uniref:Cysteine dioxygenase n=1 Tax=Acanthaster planci TaxID=133434 RepID=A0A8B7YDW9_ACAPL|nr:cysteine dioxygenase type 1-like [Acanthaster planci]